jgi:hypothetical protein
VREWRGGNSAAFQGPQRHAQDAVSTQLYELSRAVRLLSGNQLPRSAGAVIIGEDIIGDGDKGDILVSSSGTQWDIEGVDKADIVYLEPGSGLQSTIDSLGQGGVIHLGKGTYTGDITLANNDISIYGAGRDETVLSGSVTVQANNNMMSNLWVKATGKDYGLKIFKSTAGPNRNDFRLLRFGGTINSSDGPAGPGVWLDGAILNVFDHCVMGFNGGSGTYINTTDPSAGSFTTNVNTFRDCTHNLNDRYAVEIDLGVAGVGGEPTPAVAGMQQNVFVNGNMEQNTLGVSYIKSAFWTVFDNIDMESALNLGSNGKLIDGNNASYIILKDCSVRSTGDTARFFVLSGCLHGRVHGCRVTGKFPNMDIGVFDEDCVRCVAYDNAWWDPNTNSVNPLNGQDDTVSPRWISNRGQNRGYSA